MSEKEIEQAEEDGVVCEWERERRSWRGL